VFLDILVKGQEHVVCTGHLEQKLAAELLLEWLETAIT
jgi:hypothetical protein